MWSIMYVKSIIFIVKFLKYSKMLLQYKIEMKLLAPRSIDFLPRNFLHLKYNKVFPPYVTAY